MSDTGSFAEFLAALAPLFAAESRPGGDAAARALREIAATDPPLPATHPDVDLTLLDQLNEVPISSILAPMLPQLTHLNWHYSGLSDGRIREDIARHMLTVEMIGPTGMIPHKELRIGLFFQSKALDYVTREHAAEETFHMLAGQAFWSCGDGPLESHSVGDAIHHPSMAPHKSVTDKSPLLAAWRWTGDIAYEGYALTG